MKLYDAFCWFLLSALAVAIAMAIISTDPDNGDYELVCRGEKAYVEYKRWSARVANANDLCALEYKPLSLLM